MTAHATHTDHEHVHGDCQHPAVRHGDHVDHLHDGHLHSVHGDHVDEHVLAVDSANPDVCTNGHACAAHEGGHVHSDVCGHPEVPHGDHTDYFVDGHIHHRHGAHCDDHGQLVRA